MDISITIGIFKRKNFANFRIRMKFHIVMYTVEIHLINRKKSYKFLVTDINFNEYDSIL